MTSLFSTDVVVLLKRGDRQMTGSYDDAVPACCCEGGPEPKSKVVDLPADYFKWQE